MPENLSFYKETVDKNGKVKRVELAKLFNMGEVFTYDSTPPEPRSKIRS